MALAATFVCVRSTRTADALLFREVLRRSNPTRIAGTFRSPRGAAGSRYGGALLYQVRQQKYLICRQSKPSDGLEPSTPSLPWKFGSGTRVHARSFAVTFVLQIAPSLGAGNARACPCMLRRRFLLPAELSRWTELPDEPTKQLVRAGAEDVRAPRTGCRAHAKNSGALFARAVAARRHSEAADRAGR